VSNIGVKLTVSPVTAQTNLISAIFILTSEFFFIIHFSLLFSAYDNFLINSGEMFYKVHGLEYRPDYFANLFRIEGLRVQCFGFQI